MNMVDYETVMRIYNGDSTLTATDLYSPDYAIQNTYFNIAVEAENYKIIHGYIFDLHYFRDAYKVFSTTVGLLIDRKRYDMLIYLAKIQARQRRMIQIQMCNLHLDILLENFGRLDKKLRNFLLSIYRCRDITDQIHTKFDTWSTDMVLLNRYDTELMDYETYCYNQWCLGKKQFQVDKLILDHWEVFFQYCVQIDNHSLGTRVITLTFLNMIQENDLDLVIQYVRGHCFEPHSTFYLLYSYGLYLSKSWFSDLYAAEPLNVDSDNLLGLVTYCYLYEQWHEQWSDSVEMSSENPFRRSIEKTYEDINWVLSRVFAMRRINKWFSKEYALGGCIDKVLYAPPDGLMLRRGIKECCT